MFTKDKTNICKGVAILFLVFHHLYRTPQMVSRFSSKFFLLDAAFVPVFATCLRVCVWIFAFLSAYGLSYKYLCMPKEKRKVFVPAQYLSLMKPFWFMFIVLVILYLVSGHSLMGAYENRISNIVLDFFGVSDFFGTPKLRGVFWYMCFAQLMILFIPMLVKACEKYGYLILAMSFIVMQFVQNAIVSAGGGSYLQYFMVVVAGVLAAQKDLMNRLAQKVQQKTVWYRLAVMFLLIVAAGISIYFRQRVIADDPRRIKSLCSAFSAIAVCVAFGIYLPDSFVSKALAFLGKYSGGIFLLHTMIYGYYPSVVYLTHIGFLDYLILVCECLFAVYIIQWIQKKTGYYMLGVKTVNKLEMLLNKNNEAV